MYADGLTDVGKARSQNQDAIFVSPKRIGPLPNLFMVADGMGGHNAGDVASRQAIKRVSAYIRDFPAAYFVQPENYMDLLVNAAQHANVIINAYSQSVDGMDGMGTTFTACVVVEGKAIIAHVGDSRVYSVSPMKITQITKDHTYVEELLQSGKVSEEEARVHPKRHVLTRVMGVAHICEIDGIVCPLAETLTLLLCSDGLSNMLEDEVMMKIVNRKGTAEERVRYLVDEANRMGGQDNISAILIDVGR